MSSLDVRLERGAVIGAGVHDDDEGQRRLGVWQNQPDRRSFAEIWGSHLADSPITDILLKGDNVTMTLDNLSSMLAAEVAAINQFLLDMAVAVDELVDAIEPSESDP